MHTGRCDASTWDDQRLVNGEPNKQIQTQWSERNNEESRLSWDKKCLVNGGPNKQIQTQQWRVELVLR